MIGRLGGRKADGLGSGFKGAGLYYLHDKDHAVTNERVGVTYAVNLNTQDPQAAINAMAATAINQKQIKEQAGSKATGRKLAKPVFTYSLSWHAEDKPTAAHMVEQAKDTLKVLGFAENQALIVQHLDTEHPHVHVIANRINPQTGLAVKPSFSKQKLSQWAKTYEEENQIRCEGRFKGEPEKAQEAEIIPELEHTPDNDNITLPEAPEVEQEDKQPVNTEPETPIAVIMSERSEKPPTEIPREAPQSWPLSSAPPDSNAKTGYLDRVKQKVVMIVEWMKDKAALRYERDNQRKQQSQHWHHKQQERDYTR